ncbi:MAG: TRAP transporter substrate-binding protein [Nitrospirae bacterium]|uniref:TRAP transporter substrate-binding protein n=1 Tax=Candidatus Magnetobacterium casense TaxID=1455061 RepID=UPI00058C71F4|nr:TRAP transporter substrate-binding protein [Candidatus Magnetobacterium casensis]MBF0337756.1 TRAP transporter substrate-binding protein [Nitrospirota bacterium]
MQDNVAKASNRRYVIVAAIVLFIALGGVFYFYPSVKSGSKSVKAKEAKVYELSLAHNMPPGSAIGIAAQKFVDTVRDKTNGSVKINIATIQQLGDDYAMISMALDGQLDILLSPTTKLSMVHPALQYADIPFLFPHIEDAYAMLDGRVGRLLLEGLGKAGLIGVAFWGNGFKQFIATRPVLSPKDFDGMKVRVKNNNIAAEQFTAFGAQPVPTDVYKSYEALKSRAIDAQENSVADLYALKLYEVASHLTMSNHGYRAYVFCFSKNVLERLPDDIVQVLITTAMELTSFERELVARQEEDYIKAMKEAGVNVIYLNEQQTDAFKNATSHIINKYRTIVGEDVIAMTQEYIRQKYTTGE